MSTSLAAFTLLHVAISLLAIAAGFIVVYGMLARKSLPAWTAFFLVTTVLTSATGFGFPFTKILPSHILAVLSLIVLAAAIYARYAQQMVGRWRSVYVVGALVAFYLNFFVLVVQSFQKIPALHTLAPTQTEWPFAMAQLIVLIAFAAVGYRATVRFRDAAISLA